MKQRVCGHTDREVARFTLAGDLHPHLQALGLVGAAALEWHLSRLSLAVFAKCFFFYGLEAS